MLISQTRSQGLLDIIYKFSIFVKKKSLPKVMNANLLLFKTVVALDSWGLVAVPLIQYNPIAAVIFCGCWAKTGGKG